MHQPKVTFVWSTEHLEETVLADEPLPETFFSFLTSRKRCLAKTDPIATYLSAWAIPVLIIVGILYRVFPHSEDVKAMAKLLRPASEVVLIWGVSETMLFFPYLTTNRVSRTLFSIGFHALQFGFYFGLDADPTGYALTFAVGTMYLFLIWSCWGECPYASSAASILGGTLAYFVVRLDTELF